MINKENKNKLYNGVLEEKQLTTKQLNEYGFNSRDLNKLIQEGSIERVKRGLYSFKSVNNLFLYGKDLISLKEYEKANLCFEKCFELDPTHLGACFQLFLKSIDHEDYQRTFELYKSLSKSQNEFYNIDYNYYLYLLSIITEVPESNRDYAKCLELKDIKIPPTDKRYKDIPLQNEVRIAAFQRKFNYAIKQLNDLIKKHNKLTLQDIIARKLLIKAANAEVKSKNTIVNLIKEKKYKEVVDYLINKQYRHNLSISEEYILKLVKQFIVIRETSKVPEVKFIQIANLFDAIDANDYAAALELCIEYNENNNFSNESSAIKLILDDICTLVNSLSKSQQEEQTFNVEENKQVQTSSEVYQPETTFSSIISYLMKNELENAFCSLKSYLKSIGKTNFEFLIVDLIKISLLENDTTFTRPMVTLALINEDNYSFDISSYIQDFYVALSQNEFEEARIYLDIISKSDKLGQVCVITDGMSHILELSEKNFNYKRDNSLLVQVESRANVNETQEDASDLIDNSSVDTLVQEDSVIIEKSVLEDKPDIKEIQNRYIQESINSEKEFVAEKYKELIKRKDIILLRPMNDDRIDKILCIAKDYPDMIAFAIGSGNKQQIVLKYKSQTNGYVDVKKYINLANEAYKNKKYDECIKINLQLLQIFNRPKESIYSKLGLAYMKKGNIQVAIDYLTIATELSKKDGTDFDFSDLILSLKGEIQREDRKPRFKMKQNDFNYDDVNNFYGIENFEEINSFIIDSGLDVQSACQQMNMTLEQIDIIKLIYAREFYIQGNYEKGDLFLNSVEKSKNKTNVTKKLFEEVRKNKRFYQNRQIGETRSLALSLVPRKK